jgi:hypothetical protein
MGTGAGGMAVASDDSTHRWRIDTAAMVVIVAPVPFSGAS